MIASTLARFSASIPLMLSSLKRTQTFRTGALESFPVWTTTSTRFPPSAAAQLRASPPKMGGEITSPPATTNIAARARTGRVTGVRSRDQANNGLVEEAISCRTEEERATEREHSAIAADRVVTAFTASGTVDDGRLQSGVGSGARERCVADSEDPTVVGEEPVPPASRGQRRGDDGPRRPDSRRRRALGGVAEIPRGADHVEEDVPAAGRGRGSGHYRAWHGRIGG